VNSLSFECTFIAGFRNNFQDHRRVTKQYLETQAALRKPEQALWRGLLEWISQLLSDFIEASETFLFGFPSQKDNWKLWKTEALIQKFEKMFISWNFPFKEWSLGRVTGERICGAGDKPAIPPIPSIGGGRGPAWRSTDRGWRRTRRGTRPTWHNRGRGWRRPGRGNGWEDLWIKGTVQWDGSGWNVRGLP